MEHYKNDKVESNLAGCWINIVGPHLLQNSLLASFIEEKTAASCTIIDSSKNGRLKLILTDKPSLTLIDSHGEDTEHAMHLLGKCPESGHINQFIAFFNALENSPLESLITPPDIRGIFFQNTSSENFIKGISSIFNGNLWFPRRLMDKYFLRENKNIQDKNNSKEQDLLTRREIQILCLLSTGAKDSDIADNLCLSIHTIKTHIYHIYKKIDVENRTQAINWANYNL